MVFLNVGKNAFITDDLVDVRGCVDYTFLANGETEEVVRCLKSMFGVDEKGEAIGHPFRASDCLLSHLYEIHNETYGSAFSRLECGEL